METSDPHIPDRPERQTTDQPRAEAYEPPSVTEIGSFRELTEGGGEGGGDLTGASD
jgi:hypothetical protein